MFPRVNAYKTHEVANLKTYLEGAFTTTKAKLARIDIQLQNTMGAISRKLSELAVQIDVLNESFESFSSGRLDELTVEARANVIRLETAFEGFRMLFEEASLAILAKVNLIWKVVRSLEDNLNEQAALRIKLLVEIVNHRFASLSVILRIEFTKAKAAILEEIQAELKNVINLITSSKEEILANNNFDKMATLLEILGEGILEELTAVVELSKRSIEGEIKTRASSFEKVLTTAGEKIDKKLSLIKNEIIAAALLNFDLIETSIGGAIMVLTTEIGAVASLYYLRLLSNFSFQLRGVKTAITALTIKVKLGLDSIYTLLGLIKIRLIEIDESIKALPDSLKQAVKEGIEEATPFLSSALADKVVGESYYRWASTATFFPTLVLVFKQTGDQLYSSRSQIKLRLNTENKLITEAFVEELKAKLEGLRGLGWTNGSLRGNYVSANKSFKTTVFGSDKSTIKNVLSQLCPLCGEPFDQKNLSFTEDRNRENLTKRNEPLSGVGPLEVLPRASYRVELFRASLLVNGLERPITLLEKKNEKPPTSLVPFADEQGKT